MQTKFPEIWAALAAPFPPDQVKERAGGGGMKLKYITARLAMNRLDSVLGPENWQDSYVETKDGLCCTITVRLPDGTTLSKSDGGGFAKMPEEDNVEKSGYSDAFKRAAVKFGVARYLYNDGLPDFVDALLNGRRPILQFIQDAAAYAGVTVADLNECVLRQMAADKVPTTGYPLVDFPPNDGPEFRKMITRVAKGLKAENEAESAAGVK